MSYIETIENRNRITRKMKENSCKSCHLDIFHCLYTILKSNFRWTLIKKMWMKRNGYLKEKKGLQTNRRFKQLTNNRIIEIIDFFPLDTFACILKKRMDTSIIKSSPNWSALQSMKWQYRYMSKSKNWQSLKKKKRTSCCSERRVRSIKICCNFSFT